MGWVTRNGQLWFHHWPQAAIYVHVLVAIAVAANWLILTNAPVNATLLAFAAVRPAVLLYGMVWYGKCQFI